MPCQSSWDRDGTLPTKDDPNSELDEWYTVLSNFSNTLADELLTYKLTGQTFYLALHSTACTNALAGTELSGNGYARTAATFTKLDSRQWHNAAVVTGPTASGDWTAATYVSLWDDATAGNYLAWAQLSAAQTVLANNNFAIPAEALIFKFDE